MQILECSHQTPVLGAEHPGPTWSVVASPETVGWSAAGLGAVRSELARLGSTACMVVVGGRRVLEWGGTSRPINVPDPALRCAEVRA